ncbi:MAG: hypothetical protein CYG60_20035 [Actinobacteria bacterium]|nr:MAG: hypothetical protein CYG60_20035 [Actinomycetota bacterium]
MESPFAGVLNRRLLLELAGERFFERGEDYYRRGAVRSLIEYEGTLTARVLGTHEYRVKFRIHQEGGLSYSCSCPVGADGLFCKHCVAVGLARLEQRTEQKSPQEEGGGQGLTMEELEAFLEGQDKDVLVRLLLEQAMEDERLYGRLLMWAARTRSEGVDLATFRKAIDDAFYPGDLLNYGSTEDFTRAIADVVESISELLEEGLAKEAIELCEYALKAAEGAMDYDVDGYVSGALEELEELHHAACKEAKVDPRALARRLFEWELDGHHDTFFEAANTYADVLGEEGLAEYRRLAEERWAQIPVLGPGEEDPRRYSGERFRITHIMESLARQEEDIEELVGVISRDLSGPHSYLRIAQIYTEAGQSEKALEWAEEAMWVFPDRRHSGLREFVAHQYHHGGRHEEATQLIWPRFAKSPRLESYEELKKHAERAEQWEKWRNKALDHVREDIAKRKEGSGRSYFSLPVDHSELVRIFLWEDDVEAAWREAEEGGCTKELWLELASRREEEHPEEALAIYRSRIEPLVEQTNNAAYKEAHGLLVKARGLMRRLDREAEFEEYVRMLRTRYKRKRNFMKLLKGLE